MPYTNSRPENLYLTSFYREPGPKDDWEPYEDTPEEYLEAIRNPKVCRYAIKTTKAGRWLECEMYPIWLSSRDVPKRPPCEPSSPAQQALNERNSARQLTRKINANFIPHTDYWCTFTSDNNHLCLTEDEGKKIMSRFLERLRYLYKKWGVELKYAYTLEFTKARDKYKRQIKDENGSQMLRMHVHMVLNAGPSVEKIRGTWKNGDVRQVKLLQPQRTGFAGLAHYITKESRHGSRRYSCSLNLKTPQPTVAYNKRAASKTAVQRIASDAHQRPDFF